MRNLLITVIATCFFVGGLYGHDVIYSPQPMILTFGGQDGTIAVVLVGDEPSPDCEVSASAQPEGAVDLVSVTPATPHSTMPAGLLRLVLSKTHVDVLLLSDFRAL